MADNQAEFSDAARERAGKHAEKPPGPLQQNRRISSGRLIFSRYAALVSVMLLPVLVTAAMAQVKVMNLYPGASVDLFAFARYSMISLLPSLMMAAAVGVFVTELGSGLTDVQSATASAASIHGRKLCRRLTLAIFTHNPNSKVPPPPFFLENYRGQGCKKNGQNREKDTVKHKIPVFLPEYIQAVK